jgi:hypothetical protein
MVLELGKLQKYSCLFSDDKLVRQGNLHVENPNHFWNALFYAFKEYRNLSSLNEQIEYIQRRRTELAKQIVKKDWSIYNESHSQILPEFTRRFVNDTKMNPIIMKLLSNKETIMDDILCELSEYDNLYETISKALQDTFFEELGKIEKTEKKKISQEKKDKCLDIFKRYIQDIWKQAEDVVFTNFINDLQDIHKGIDVYNIPFFLSILNIKVFFIDYKTRDLLLWNEYYESFMKTDNECDNFVLILSHDNILFESLGVIYPDDDKNVQVCRLFTKEDEIIQACYNRL